MARLTAGTRIGPYEVESVIGAGGMGEVYRARDTRLGRTVAIKVLLSSGTVDPQLRDRFERESRAISSLNHPHICILHDVGHERPSPSASADDGQPIDFLVMEYLEGETLASRLERGPLPLTHAVDVAIQIASALDRAHRQGIVHRDLKPGNVMLTRPPTAAGRSGAHVKLLDFGLARLVRPGSQDPDGSGPGIGVTDLTTPALSAGLTLQGTVLGTLPYMSPEQLQGRAADARTDIFAFGALMYEMIAGRRPFDGKSQASVIGAILDQEPPSIVALQPATPPLLAELVARCLAKEPDERWQSSRDLLRQLEWIAAHALGGTAPAADDRSSRVSGWARIVRAGIVLVVAAAASGGLVAWVLRPEAPPAALVSRFTVDVPPDEPFTRTGRRLVTLSRDGSQLVYVANRQLYRRYMNELAAAPIPGTANTDPSEPVFAPDGQWLAFWSGEAIWKIPAIGGAPVRLSAAENPTGMWWGERLLVGQGEAGIIDVPTEGGDATTVVSLDNTKQEQAQSPHLIAGGRAVLFTLRTGNQGWDDATIVIEDLASHERTIVVRGGTDARVSPTGHLIYSREGTLFAVPFDERALAVRGVPQAVQRDVAVATAGFTGAAQIALSDSGTLAFVPGRFSSQNQLVWIDRQGRLEPAPVPHRRYQTGSSHLRISPDGARVAMTILAEEAAGQSGAGQDIWIWDIARNALTRLSFTSRSTFPVWTPDSRRVCYMTGPDVSCQNADGTGQPETMFTEDDLFELGPVSPDGRWILMEVRAGYLAMAPFVAGGKVQQLTAMGADVEGPAFSPDGRWLAYESHDSVVSQVFVRPFPEIEAGKWQVSTGGGSDPAWSRDGREVFFLDISTTGTARPGAIMSAAVSTSARFEAAPATVALKYPPTAARGFAEGGAGRFLLLLPASATADQTESRERIILVQNWTSELERLVPMK